ncbi:MAG: inositol monophosphatase family protein [Candidatus Bipolaricaulota bacterium]|nr:inositol monophosphatase [Candidatus Bipolaricaulota bacterium]
MEEEILDLAKSAAEEAGELLVEGLGKKRMISSKSGPTDLVTQYDRESQELIVDKIQDYYPNHSILAEEELGVERSSTKWIIDPLDGTTNYIYNYPLFDVSIGVEVEGEIRVGVIYVPLLGETYAAVKGSGATLNGEPISVSTTDELSSSLLSTGFPYDKDLMPKARETFSNLLRKSRGIRRDGAAGVDLAYLASGKFDGFWELGLSPWDVAAGSLIIEEAGGYVTDFSGGNHDIYESQGIVATNGNFHEELLSKLS